MGKAGCFLLGFVISSWVTCIVAYYAGHSLLEEYRELHNRAIDYYSKAHADLAAAIGRVEEKASAIGKAITE